MHIDEKRLDSAMSLVNDAVSKGYFPGAEVVVGQRDKVLRSQCFGNRCIYKKVLPVLDDTMYDLASLTKVTATNTLFMVFLEKGLISVYDKVSDFLECFKGADKDDITIFNLLTHTAGFVPFKPLYETCTDYEDAIRYICSLDLIYKPGTKVEYSDFSYILLGYILEEIGHDRLDHLCEKYVFNPLDMKNTCFNPKANNIAATEVDKSTGKVLIGTVHDENARFLRGIAGHAGLFSNKEDMTKFANMLINKGNGFISYPAFCAMTRNYTENLNENRGFGWCIKGSKLSSGGDIISPSAFGHTGFTGTSIWIDTENDIYIILLTNRVHPTRENNRMIKFRRRFHNAVLASVKLN